jgi:Fur family ferric uptake transcriptional regulator
MTTDHHQTAAPGRGEEILRGNGLKKTIGRVKILEALMAAGRPLAGSELHTALGRDAMDQASIYRVLSLFAERGIVHKIDGRDKVTRFALTRGGSPHAHFTCRSCGRMDCMYGTATTTVYACPKGYILEEESVLFSGLCAECSKGQ